MLLFVCNEVMNDSKDAGALNNRPIICCGLHSQELSVYRNVDALLCMITARTRLDPAVISKS